MLGNNKGQISVEVVLLVGLILVIVLAVGSYLGEDIELNKVMAAAKTGSIDASNDLAYTGEGNVIRFNNMTFSNGNISIIMYSTKTLSSGDKVYIQSKSLQNVANVLNKPVINDNVEGRYKYSVTVVNAL